jgi:8-oxo-dGTP pyrophosphatase MutT (NUDIX family)
VTESPAPPEAPVRDAATVVLLRDGTEGIEAWLLTRVVQMAFAAGMTVFPGGRVDPADASLPLVGGDVPTLAARFGCDEPTAHALLGAAVRETFEETGVLLSVPVADLSGARADVERGLVSFGELLRTNDLAIDGNALHPWSRWVTPAGEARRYDTRFFVGALPDAAVAQDVTSESSAAAWVPVLAAIEEAQRGERKMLPPTMATLASLAQFDTVAEVVASSSGRQLDPVRPQVRVGEDGSVAVELPDGSLVPVPRSMFS